MCNHIILAIPTPFRSNNLSSLHIVSFNGIFIIDIPSLSPPKTLRSSNSNIKKRKKRGINESKEISARLKYVFHRRIFFGGIKCVGENFHTPPALTSAMKISLAVQT